MSSRPPLRSEVADRELGLLAAAIEPLQAWSFFWEWDLTESLVRWMTSFTTTPDDVARFAAGVRTIVAGHLPA